MEEDGNNQLGTMDDDDDDGQVDHKQTWKNLNILVK